MSDVYNRIELENGRVLIDITDATATANDVISGSKFHDATGNLVNGTAALKDDADDLFVTGIAYDSVTEKRYVASVDSTKSSDGDVIRSTTKIATPETIVSASDNKNIVSYKIIKGKSCYRGTTGSPIVGTGIACVRYSNKAGSINLNNTDTSYTYTFTESDIKYIRGCKYCTIYAGANYTYGIWGMQSHLSSCGIDRIFIKNNGEIPVGTYSMSFYSHDNYGSSTMMWDTNKITLSVEITETQMRITKSGTLVYTNVSVYLMGHNVNIYG